MTSAAHVRQPAGIRGRRIGWALCSVLALAVVPACSGDSGETPDEGKTPTTSSSSPSPTPSPSADPQSTAEAEALETYEQYWDQMELRYADPEGKKGKLGDFAAAVALLNAEKDAESMHKRGTIITGHVTVRDPQVKVDLGKKLPYATISSCLDISKWTVVDSKTKKPAELPKDRLLKYVVTAEVEKWPEGWRVITEEPKGEAC
ncbi:hypothetical protein [Streptomyces sp. N35]|uniref:hypothetical protein n=1 Tax=Streptomyces sp. N35 TaxID=2795730 RepID=UPI001F1601FA|nr:hypothetical protein [Streptomyces sp. N35]